MTSSKLVFMFVLLVTMLMSSGLSSAEGIGPSPYICKGACTSAAACDNLCHGSGFTKGGACVGLGGPPSCCCTK
ncbi:hypothetical protein RND81_10G108800 [Saponaria officinalis]|uniref:Uncharacterized protein n=1 Tax=Saponaria officinalis TaxID=3572 RepID=A0AAW1I0R1_SAPOF